MSDRESPKIKKNVHAVAIGRIGGNAKAKKYGPEGMRAMANKRWKAYKKESFEKLAEE